MITPLSQKIISTLILGSFLIVAIFSLLVVAHGPDGQMSGDCPFLVTNTALCPQDLIASVSHHLNAYHAFLNVTVKLVTTLFILSLILVARTTFLLHRPALLLDPHQFKIGFYSSPPTSEQRKISRWLSLLENSPSLTRSA